MKLKKVVTIFGAGSWGTAIAKNISENGYRVRIWAKEKNVVDSIITKRENKIFLPGVKLPSSIYPTNSLDTNLFDSDFLIFSIPTQFIRESLLLMKEMISKDSILINTSKGIEQSSMKPIYSIFKEILPRVSRRCAHNFLFPEILKALKEKGLEELVVFGGGIIPDQDIEGLKKIGVKEIFGPGTTTTEMIDWINKNIQPK